MRLVDKVFGFTSLACFLILICNGCSSNESESSMSKNHQGEGIDATSVEDFVSQYIEAYETHDTSKIERMILTKGLPNDVHDIAIRFFTPPPVSSNQEVVDTIITQVECSDPQPVELPGKPGLRFMSVDATVKWIVTIKAEGSLKPPGGKTSTEVKFGVGISEGKYGFWVGDFKSLEEKSKIAPPEKEE